MVVTNHVLEDASESKFIILARYPASLEQSSGQGGYGTTSVREAVDFPGCQESIDLSYARRSLKRQDAATIDLSILLQNM
jgi:hypothetical protein